MPELIQEEIQRGWKLLNEGKEEETLRLVALFEKKEDLSPEEKLKVKILKANIQFSFGNLKKGFKIAEETYREYKKLGNDFLLIDAINLKLWFLIFQGQMHSKSYLNLIEQGEIILKSISNRSPSEIVIKEARFLYSKAAFYINKGNYDLAMECCKKALELIDQFNINSLEDQKYRRYILSLIGHTYIQKGELKLALEYYEKSLALKIRDTNLEKMKDTDDFWGMGYIFYIKGDLDNSLKLFKQSLTILEELNWLGKIAANSGIILDGIIRVLIAKGDHEGTQHYLELFKQVNDENPIESNISKYHLLRAKTLKSSTRPRDRVEAENIFKEIIESRSSWLVNTALIEICDLYLKELKLTNDLTIIDEINPYISQLLENAEKENSYPILARTKLLQAKIALIQMNMGDARRLLTQAQEIADENGYQHLAQTISIEHDNLIGQLDVWENLKNTNAPISKRMDLISLKATLDLILEKRAIKPPEMLVEIPVLLLILTEGKKIALSNPFTGAFTLNHDLIIEFLSSFPTFSDQIFSERLDRVKFGQYTILITTLEPFSICYMFQGQTYSARQKLTHFTEAIKKNSVIFNLLTDAVNLGKVIEVNKYPSLEELILESFMSDPQLFRVPFKAYDGDDPFVFASYAHRDKLEVYPIIDYLNKTGINIWYDEGIPFSENWKKSIAENIDRCQEFLAFITPQIFESEYVRKEISYALKKKKAFNAVYLKETELLPELEFEIHDIQALHKYLMPDPEFSNKLREVLYTKLHK